MSAQDESVTLRKSGEFLYFFMVVKHFFAILGVRTIAETVSVFESTSRLRQQIEHISDVSETGDGILGHQFNKSVKYFAQCYSQSLLRGFQRKTILLSGFKNPHKISTKQENSSLYS